MGKWKKKKYKFKIEKLYKMIKENVGPKYSEMLMQIVEEFDELLPIELTYEETLGIGIDAWNLANNKEYLVSKNLYEKELTCFENRSVIEKMVDFKIAKFSKYNNVIIDYSTTDNILKVKTQTQEHHYNNIIRQMVSVKYK